MEESGTTNFKRRAASNANEQLVLPTERDKKIQREKQEKREETREGGCRSGSWDRGRGKLL